MVSPLIIESTSKTPEVVLNPEKKIYRISGKSAPSNAHAFFKPVLEWVKNMDESVAKDGPVLIEVDLDYLNTSSSKALFQIFMLVQETLGPEMIKVKWVCRDEDMEECGQDFEMVTKVPFEYIEARRNQSLS